MSALSLVLKKATSVESLEESSAEVVCTFYRGAIKRAARTMNFKAAETLKRFVEKTFPTVKESVSEPLDDYDREKFPVRLEITIRGSKDIAGFVLGSMRRLGVIISKKTLGDSTTVVTVALAASIAEIVKTKLNDTSAFTVKILQPDNNKKK